MKGSLDKEKISPRTGYPFPNALVYWSKVVPILRIVFASCEQKLQHVTFKRKSQSQYFYTIGCGTWRSWFARCMELYECRRQFLVTSMVFQHLSLVENTKNVSPHTICTTRKLRLLFFRMPSCRVVCEFCDELHSPNSFSYSTKHTSPSPEHRKPPFTLLGYHDST
jgi:hypothetical protein